MANSLIIGNLKNKVIKQIIKDDLIVKAIDATEVEKSQDLIGTHIFTFYQDPLTIKDVQTFMTVTVQIPKITNDNKTFVYPILEIYIVSHYRHMDITNIPKVRVNRNDYISQLLDDKFNGVDNIGIGKMDLISNLEGAAKSDYLFRKLTFELLDLNDSLCREEI